HSLVVMNPLANSVSAFRELPEKGARQYGRFVLVRRSLKEQAKPAEQQHAPASTTDDDSEFSSLREVKFELKDFVQDKVIWSCDFPKDAPEYSFDAYSGRLVFYWSLGTEVGKAKLKESPALQAKAAALDNKDDDYLVEVIDAFAQKTVATLLLDTGRGSFDIGDALSEGNWLILHDSHKRVLVYSIKDGELR